MIAAGCTAEWIGSDYPQELNAVRKNYKSLLENFRNNSQKQQNIVMIANVVVNKYLSRMNFIMPQDNKFLGCLWHNSLTLLPPMCAQGATLETSCQHTGPLCGTHRALPPRTEQRAAPGTVGRG
jgi:hypothetical protein